MAETYVVLLRGVNVGRANRVAMADLRALLGALGFANPRTLLNSGNAVVTTADATSASEVAETVRAALAARLDVSADVIALSAGDLSAIIAENPLVDAATNPSRLVVAFVADATVLAAAAPVAEQEWTPEAVAIGSRAAYVWSPEGVSASNVLPALGKALAGPVTTRNWTTVRKLASLSQVAT